MSSIRQQTVIFIQVLGRARGGFLASSALALGLRQPGRIRAWETQPGLAGISLTSRTPESELGRTDSRLLPTSFSGSLSLREFPHLNNGG